MQRNEMQCDAMQCNVLEYEYGYMDVWEVHCSNTEHHAAKKMPDLLHKQEQSYGKTPQVLQLQTHVLQANAL